MSRMEQLPHKFMEGQRVRLKDGVDPSFYGGFSVTGNEGWVRAVDREERYGYPRIFVEWDKDHWAYNNAPDIWTWEGHFDTTGDDMASEKDLFEEFLAWKASKGEEDPKAAKIPRYARIMEEAAETLGESEAFVILATRRVKHDDVPEEMLEVTIYRDALTPEAELATAVRVADLASLLFAELALSQRISHATS